MNKPFTLSIAILILISTSAFSQGWVQKADFGGTPRFQASGFSINGKGYIGIGSEVGRFRDFWEYDPSTDTWAQKANFGGGFRDLAVGFSIGNKGYIGTGKDNFGNRIDFWEYDPATNIWTRKADFAGNARTGATGFSIGNKGYIGTGNSNGVLQKDLWEYDPSTDTWQQKADFGGDPRWFAAGFSLDNKGYIGAGDNNFGGVRYKDFWEYDPSTDSWLQRADFGGTARTGAVGLSIGNKGYIGTGFDGAWLNDFWEYDPAANTWLQKESFGNNRSHAVAFSIGGKGYVGTGNRPGGSRDFWEYTPCVSVTFYLDADNDTYGDPQNTIQSCNQPGGYVSNDDDCNDANASIHPGATEICNGVDDDCDGLIDENVQSTFYRDADNDTYGDPQNTIQACVQPPGYVSNDDDCNDANASIHPGATEICNGVDDDCDGSVDENNLSVSAGADRTLYFGYLPEQCVSITANVTGGTPPYSYQWTLDRPLLYDVITPDGDESMSGANSQTVTVCLLDTATLCVTVTDAHGCTFTDCVTIFASDVRCFEGNSNAKVTICHDGHTICVSENAVATHLAHGDYVGACVGSRSNVGMVEAEQNLKPGFTVYPNPNKGDLTVTMSLTGDETKDAVIQAINVNGQIVKQVKVNNQNKLNFSIKETGIYFIKLITNKQVYTKKVTVIR